MYLAAGEDDLDAPPVPKLAKEMGIPAKVLQSALDKEREALKQAPNKLKFLRERLVSAREGLDRAEKELLDLKARAKAAHDPGRRAAALRAIEEFERKISKARAMLKEAAGNVGLGVWFIPIMGIITAGATIWLFFENKDKLGDLIGKSSDALVIGAYTAAIGVGLIGMIYFARLARDIWEPKKAER